MSWDLYLTPPSGIREWTDQQWDAFYAQEPPPESGNLGNNSYCAFVTEIITHHLERGQRGSRFPLFARGQGEDLPVWYNEDIGQLAIELDGVRNGLAALPANRSTLLCDSEDELRQGLERLQRRRGAPIVTAYDACRHFVDTFTQMAQKARSTGQGLLLSY